MFRCARKILCIPIAILLVSCLAGSAFAQNRGTFVGAVNYPAGPPTVPSNTGFLGGGVQPLDAKVADVNGDGKPDVIVAAACGSPITGYGIPSCPTSGYAVVVYLGNGDGTFQAPIFSGSMPQEIRSIAVGDFNNDGKLDVAVISDCDSTDCTQGSVSILLGAGDGTFAQASQYTFDGAALTAETAAVGDFNNDGKLDLAVGIGCFNLSVTGCANGAVSIYWGNGDGTLSAPTSYPATGNAAAYLVVGDFNGDGKLDIVAGSGISGFSALTILLGTSNGTFAESTLSFPFGLSSLAAADFNGDGKLDLSIVSSNGVQTLFGNGDGTFQSPVLAQSNLTFGVFTPFEMVVVDVNGDGKPDLLVSGAVAGDYGIGVWLNDGTGNFTATQSYPMGGGENAPIVAADFNADGKVDVVLAAQCAGMGCPDGSIDVLLGNGDGTFQGPVLITSASAGNVGAFSVGATDFNGDGFIDLFVSPGCVPGAPQTCGVAILPGNSSGTYLTPNIVPSGAEPAEYCLYADFNRDGKADLAIVNACDSSAACVQSSVSIVLGNGDGTFQPAVTYPIPGTGPVGIVTGDFNGDGILDLAAATQCSDSSCSTGAVSILLGNGDGTFQNAVTTTLGAGVLGVSIAAADFNHDGKTDIVVVGNSNLAVILLSNGGATLSIVGTYSTGGGGALSVPATGDLNHDGNIDVVFANDCEPTAGDTSCSNGSIGVLLGNGDGTFQPVQETVVTDGLLISANLTDVDGDGNLDLVSSTTSGVMVARGKGDGTFQTPVIYGGLLNSTREVLAVTDLNNDGAPDIVQTDASGNLGVFYNRGGTFLTPQSSWNPSTWGQNVTFTATVSASIAKNLTPTGTVSFYLGNPLTGTLLANAPLIAGTASLTLNNVPVGTWPITAAYSGDTNFSPHAGTPITQVVVNAVAATTTTLTSSVNPAQLGQSVTFTATVNGGTGPTGSITLNDGSTLLATVALTGNQAVYTTSALAAGSHAITATYSGDTANASSNSATLFESVLNPQSGAVLVGVVTDRNTGAPLSGVNVIFGCGSCGTQTVTDANGQYSLTAAQISNHGTGPLIFQGHGYFATQVNYTIMGTPTTVNATLLPGGTLVQGTVTDANTHLPIAGASVGISNSTQTINGLGTTTDSNGNFAFDSSLVMDSVAAGFPSQGLSASSPGYFTYIGSGFQVAPPYPVVMNVAMIPSVGTVLQGTVTDRNTGVPLPGVNVIFGCGSCGTQTVTDANGQYSLTAAQISNHGIGPLVFQGRGYFATQVNYTISSSPTTVNATLLPGGTLVQGTVTDANTHLPIAGASVGISNSTQTINGLGTTTDSNGNFAFDSSLVMDSVAAGFPSQGLSASSPGYFTYIGSGFQVAPPYPVVMNVAMIPAVGTVLQGTVTDRNTGVPLPGVNVIFGCGSCGTQTVTDANGQYSLTAAQISNHGIGALIFQGRGYFATQVNYTIVSTPTTVNATLLAGGTLVQGMVTDANTHLPVAGARVGIGNNTQTINGLSATSDNSGSFAFDSSLVFDSVAGGFSASGLSVSSSPGYFVYSGAPFMVQPPYPVIQNAQLTPTGTTVLVNVTTNPANLQISVDGAPATAPASFTWVPGNPHTIATNTPQPGSTGTQYVFAGWNNAGAISQTIVTAASSTTYTASFNTQYLLTTSASPAGGGTITTGGWFNAGTSVTITATPNAGYQFTSFSGALSGTSNPQTVVMNGPISVAATFAPVVALTTTALATSANPDVFGQSVTFTAAVSGVNSPTGSVTFKDAANVLATVALTGNQAVLNTSSLTVGSHPIVAIYNGDSSNSSSTSPVVYESVTTLQTGAVLYGTVTDRSTGLPLAGVSITNCTPCQKGVTPLTATTDASGNYSLTAAQLGNTASGSLNFQILGYFVNVASYTNITTPTILDVTLLPGGTVLQGAVTDGSTQAGIAGASLTITTTLGLAFPKGAAISAITNPTGQYSIDSSNFYENAAVGFTGTAQLTATGYFSSVVGVSGSTPFPATQNFTMLNDSGVVLQGAVTDRSTGFPIAGAVVTNCSQCSKGGGALTTTDANGNYTLTGAQLSGSASGVLYFQAPGYYVKSSSYSITVIPTTLNTTLLAGGTVLQGTVTDLNTQAGIVGAALGIQIQVTQGQGQGPVFPSGNSLTVTTAAGGQYAVDSSNFFETGAAGFSVTGVQLSATGYFNSTAAGFAVAAPFPVTQNFTMSADSGVVLQGAVTDRSTGLPIAGVSVTNCAMCKGSAPAITDANGNYSLTGAELNNSSSGTLYFQAPGYYVNTASFSITVSPTNLNVTLLPGGTILQGTVMDASTQAGIVGASFFVAPQGQQALAFPNGVVTVTTTFGGQYTIDSSNFYEAAATGFTVSQSKLFATGYNPGFFGPFSVAPPFPVTQNFTMSSTGTPVVVTIATNPAGLGIIVDGTSYTAPQTFQWQPSNSHTITTTTPQAGASPGTQYGFSAWSDGGGLSHMVVAPGSTTTYTASFNTQYLLTTATNPSADGSITTGGYFNVGSSVTIAATPNSGYTFTGFSGDLNGTTNPQTLVMDSPKSVTASFAPSIITTTTSITAPAVSFGTPASVSVSVTAAQGTAAGNVSLAVDNGAPLTQALSNGSTIFSISGLAVGSHNLSAGFAAQGNFGASSGTGTLQVNQATTTVSVSNIPSTAVFGSGFISTYSYSGDGIPSTVSSTPSTCTVSGSAVNFVGAGTCTLTARATAGTNYAATTGSPQPFTIAQATTATTIVSSQNPQIVNQSITFTATVSSQFGGVATGSVVFKNGATTLGTAPLSGNQGSFTTSFATAGTRSITAQYAGDNNNLSSTSSALSQSVVAKFATTTMLVSSPNPSFVGQLVTFTATVTSAGGAPPNGEIITFKQGATTLATAPLSGGSASFTISTLVVGTHTVTASYAGDSAFNASTSAGLKQVVNKYATTTSLVSSLNPSTFGQSVTFTAAVTSAGPITPTGNVVFKNGTTTLATVALSSGGVATLTRNNLPAGTLSITATYNGDTQSATSSAPLSQVINVAVTSTTVTSSRNPSTFGQSVTLTATVTSPTTTPTGTVIFTSGSTTLGTVTLSGGKASLSTKTLPRGANSITATYNGTANIKGSSASLSQQVN